MEPGRFDPTYSSELLKHMDKQNEILMEAYRSMLHESQKLQLDKFWREFSLKILCIQDSVDHFVFGQQIIGR
ncbi:hypothetical protein AAHE18_18G062600 [Arachis hypogaea]